jgi:hypothetical protein
MKGRPEKMQKIIQEKVTTIPLSSRFKASLLLSPITYLKKIPNNASREAKNINGLLKGISLGKKGRINNGVSIRILLKIRIIPI